MIVTQEAIDFTSSAILPDGAIEEHFHFFQSIENRYAVLFFYPLNFTFVCPTEMVALSRSAEAFKKRGVEVITVSVDSHFAHLQWRQMPIDQGGIGPVAYTMVADVGHQICRAYGVEHPDKQVAMRATFIVDKKKCIRHSTINDLPIGRSVDEILRLVDAVQFSDTHGEVCPVNWQQGEKTFKPDAHSLKNYLEEQEA